MIFYVCQLTLHDNVFFASREMGTLYETEKYLHNWALSYALFESTYIPRPYRLEGVIAQQPGYLDANNEQNLLHLNELGIYVFPALPIRWSHQINKFKASSAAYHDRPQKIGDKGADRNYPINYGQAKELVVGSKYRTYIIAPETVQIPRWIRLGKWASKIQVNAKPIPGTGIEQASGEFICKHPLNPIDLPGSTHLLLYNRIVMPPVSLLNPSQLRGNHWKISKPSEWSELREWADLRDLPSEVCLPSGVSYGANTVVATL